jgi:outer membrane protein OmpA-like peptidoglycan-associated protein
MLQRLAFCVLGIVLVLALAGCCNKPPTLNCAVEPTTVVEGDIATINTNAVDPNNDVLTTVWTASEGNISGQDGTASFDTTGLAPGTYRVSADVRDKKHQVSCAVDVTVTKNKQPPVVDCGAGSASVVAGGSTTLQATASDPNGDSISYSWSVDGQSVTNNSPSFTFGSAGRSVGSHRVQVTVTDVDGMTASCTFNVMVNERPNPPLSLSLGLDKSEVYECETVTATARASDPDNDPVTYSWKVDGQTQSGTGSVLKIDTCGFAGGNHTVSVTAKDDRGDSKTQTASFKVTEKITIQMSKMKPDNVAKAKLDEIAVKMQQNSQLRAVITGHTDDTGSEENNVKVGQRRADAAKAYLVDEHQIDEGRIETKSAGEGEPVADNGTKEGREENRRVVVELSVR